MATNERGSLLGDLFVETVESWRAMSPAWQLVLMAGAVAIIVLNAFGHAPLPPVLLAALRVVALSAVIVGCVANARAADEFYQRVYLYASTFTLVVSVPILYALAEFGVNLGVRSISLVAAVFGVAFVAAFAAMRRG